ncbi:FAD-binding oxidoreductase [Kineococcus mangrovi]|uniref:FAD-binding oxidoreductase n=1 Tax=Kineococcus mangrovi TaxID=1660183 RepID=UPI0035213339
MRVGVAETFVHELRGRIPGERVVCGPDALALACRPPDAAAGTGPAALVRCRHAADVLLAVRAAREAGLPLSVLGRGHDRAGRSPVAGGVVLDVQDLRSVAVDPATATAHVGGGVSSLDVAVAGAPHGLVPVTGWRGDAGLVGLSLGGGCGPLTGRAGLAADNLLGAVVVLADGTRVDTDDDPDLLWALRGGGGDVGVVVQARLALHRARVLVGGTIVYPWSRAPTVLAGLADLLGSAPDELTVRSGVRRDPDGRPVVVVQPVWSGDPAAWTGRPGPVPHLATLGTPLSTDVAPLTLVSLLGDEDRARQVGGATRHELVRTRTLERLDPAATQALLDAGRTMTSPRSRVWLHHFHGAADRVDPASAALPLRRPHLVAEVVAGWDEAGRGALHRAWADRVAARLSWTALGGDATPLGPGEADRVTDVHGTDAVRLLELKTRYDPDGIFRSPPPPQSDSATTPA